MSDKVYEVPAEWSKRAYIDDADYKKMYAASLADSGNPTEYGNLTVAGSLTVGSLPATLTSGTPTARNCAHFASSPTTNAQDNGSPCPSLFTRYSMGTVAASVAPNSANTINVSVIYFPTFSSRIWP